MSKEEILYKYERENLSVSGLPEYSYCVARPAMSEYAEQQSIAFAAWLNENHYIYNYPSKKYLDDNYVVHTPEELYQLFSNN